MIASLLCCFFPFLVLSYSAAMSCENTQQGNSAAAPNYVIYDEDDVIDGIELCSKSLIGQIITQKPIHLNNLHNALGGIWCNPLGFRMEEIYPKTFQFFFDSEDDANRILKGSPWLFRNSWTSKMGRKIGVCLGKVGESEVYEGRYKITFVKLSVEIDIHKPLLPGILVGSHEDGISWVDFKFERLPQLCYKCGHIGHDEDSCKIPIADDPNAPSKDKELGPWMRASYVGRKATTVSNDESSSRQEFNSPTRADTDSQPGIVTRDKVGQVEPTHENLTVDPQKVSLPPFHVVIIAKLLRGMKAMRTLYSLSPALLIYHNPSHSQLQGNGSVWKRRTNH
ncbi:Zinc finger, CCHC-type [Sesbania bispinosa]|nr:Zinc finger, CCHC-type [Sesbania bispinosa]